jgi:hypothetical protein
MPDDVLYNKQTIVLLEGIWGDGFHSSGWPDEVAGVLSGANKISKVLSEELRLSWGRAVS